MKTIYHALQFLLKKKESESTSMEDYDPETGWEDDSDDESEEEDRALFWKDFRNVIGESTRLNFEEKLNNLPNVISASVELAEDYGTVPNGVSTHVTVLFSEEFTPVRDILLKDKRHSDHDILRHVETLTKFVEDIKSGSRSIEEINNLWSFDRCLDIIKGGREAEEDVNRHQEDDDEKKDGDDDYNPRFSFSINVEDIPKDFEEVSELAQRVAQEVYLFGQGFAREREAYVKEYMVEEGGSRKKSGEGKMEDKKSQEPP